MSNIRKPPKHNLVGQRFCHLCVEKMEITQKSKDRSWRSICRCDCGRFADVNTNNLMRGLRKTCGHKECEFHRQDYANSGKANVGFAGHEGIHGSKWSGIRCGAIRRGILFEIDIKEAWELFEKQRHCCALTGLPIKFGRRYVDGNTASLDRIDSNKGYVPGNVHWVHKDVNKMKMDFSMERFVEICSMVVNKHELKEKTDMGGAS